MRSLVSRLRDRSLGTLIQCSCPVCWLEKAAAEVAGLVGRRAFLGGVERGASRPQVNFVEAI